MYLVGVDRAGADHLQPVSQVHEVLVRAFLLLCHKTIPHPEIRPVLRRRQAIRWSLPLDTDSESFRKLERNAEESAFGGFVNLHLAEELFDP
jgi:hypothetical protein